MKKNISKYLTSLTKFLSFLHDEENDILEAKFLLQFVAEVAGGEEGKSGRQLYSLNTVTEMLLPFACFSSTSEQSRQGCFS